MNTHSSEDVNTWPSTTRMTSSWLDTGLKYKGHRHQDWWTITLNVCGKRRKLQVLVSSKCVSNVMFYASVRQYRHTRLDWKIKSLGFQVFTKSQRHLTDTVCNKRNAVGWVYTGNDVMLVYVYKTKETHWTMVFLAISILPFKSKYWHVTTLVCLKISFMLSSTLLLIPRCTPKKEMIELWTWQTKGTWINTGTGTNAMEVKVNGYM